MAFGLAHHLKCDPIILIGQDLGYESNLSHNPNADASGKIFHTDSGELAWQIDSPDSHLKSDTPYGMGGALLVDGYYGKPIITNAGLLSFITSFEGLSNMITDKALINATEGGANIKGFARMTLQSAIDLYFKNRVDINKLAPFLTLADNWEDGIVNAIDVFKKEISEYKELVRCCKDAIKYAGMMDHHFNHPKKLNRDIKTNEELSMKAENIAKKNPTITLSIYHASRRIFESDLNVEGKREDVMNDREKLKIRVKRNLHILNAAKSSAESLLPIYEEALILLEMVRDDNAHVLFEEDKYVPLHYDVKEYFDKGNFARPYCDMLLLKSREPINLLPSADVFQYCILMRNTVIEEAKKIKDPTERIKIAVGLEDAKRLGKAGKYQEAFDILIKIHNMAYKADIYHEELEWAIGSCAFVLYSRTQESKLLLQATTYFKGLTNKHPDNIQYKFDYANVILSTDFEKGMELLLPVVEDKRYNYFLKNIGRMYDDKGKNADAISAYCKYKELYPNDTEIDSLISNCKNKRNED